MGFLTFIVRYWISGQEYIIGTHSKRMKITKNFRIMVVLRLFYLFIIKFCGTNPVNVENEFVCVVRKGWDFSEPQTF